jgi:hypothetical protein
MNDQIIESQKTLTHYLRLVMEKSGLKFDSDNQMEIDSILIDAFTSVVMYVTELEQRIAALEAQTTPTPPPADAPTASDTTDWPAFPPNTTRLEPGVAQTDCGSAGKVTPFSAVKAWHFTDGETEYAAPTPAAAAAQAAPVKLTAAQKMALRLLYARREQPAIYTSNATGLRRGTWNVSRVAAEKLVEVGYAEWAAIVGKAIVRITPAGIAAYKASEAK